MTPSRLERWLAVLIRRRAYVALVAVVAVVVGSVASSSLKVRNDLEAFFVVGDPVLTAYHAFRERFGTDEIVLIAISDDTPLHAVDRRAELSTLTHALQAVAGVDRVQSLDNVDTVIVEGDGFSVRTVGADSVRLLAAARERHGFIERFVSADDSTQLVWLWLADDATTDAGRSAVVAGIAAAVEPLRLQRTVRVVGGGMVWEALNALTVRDGAVFISLAAIVLLSGLLLVTRRLLWGVVAVVAVTCANTIVFAAMALLDVPLNAITVCLPSLVMALGILDLLHLIGAVDDLPADVVTADDPRVAAALARVVVPGLFNIITTAVGLLALLTASTAVTRQLGGFAALGVVCAWLFCLAWTIVAVPRALHVKHRRMPRETTSLSAQLAAFSLRHRGLVIVAAVVIAAVGVVGIGRLDVDTDTLGFLPPNHRLVIDTRAVERELGPFIPLEVDLQVPSAGAWRNAAVIDGLRAATKQLAGVEVREGVRLGRAISVADVLDEAALALGSDDVPAGLAFIAVSAPALTDGLVSKDDRHLRLTVPVTLTTAQGFIAAADVVTRTVREQLAGTDVTVSLTGYLPLYARIVHALVDDQLLSFGAAFIGVFVLIGLFLRSTRLVILAALPNLLPIVGVLGLMGWCGIALDVATITIAATILGVVVDDTVHSLHHLRRTLGMGPWSRQVVEAAVLDVAHTVGRANLAGNALLAAGFLVLVAASAKSLVLVGGLSAAAVLLAVLADLLVLPALSSLLLSSSSLSSASASSSSSPASKEPV